jgi:hypothetical protein
MQKGLAFRPLDRLHAPACFRPDPTIQRADERLTRRLWVSADRVTRKGSIGRRAEDGQRACAEI